MSLLHQCIRCGRWVETKRQHICEPKPIRGGGRKRYTEPVRYYEGKEGEGAR